MVEPADGATRYLEALLNRKVDTPIGNDDIPSLGEGRDDGRNCRERLRIENGIFRPKEIRDVFLEVGMNVDCAVETRWTATSETIFPQSLSRLLFDDFISGKAGEVEAGKVHDGLAGADEFGFGTGWTRDDRERGEIQTLSFGKGLFKWFWSPFVDEFIDFLVTTYQRCRVDGVKESAYIHLFRELDEVFARVVRPGPRLEQGTNGEDQKDDF